MFAGVVGAGVGIAGRGLFPKTLLCGWKTLDAEAVVAARMGL